VLNNGTSESQTQLAGPVGGNPLLNGNPAATILNQVTAPNPSQLSGTLEVAGQRANVILANPAGITCSGCSFLNANRATLSTGRPQVGLDGSISFDVTSGTILINGAGLNASTNHQANLGQVDLIARSLQINAGVWADHLNVVTGANQVDYGSEKVTAHAPKGAEPTVALDTAALGGMYANSIRLIATEAGAGVNLSGHLAALTGDLHVDAAGQVKIAPSATLKAGENLKIATALVLGKPSGVNNAGTLLAGVDPNTGVPIEGQGNVEIKGYVLNAGTIAAGKDAVLNDGYFALKDSRLSALGKVVLGAADDSQNQSTITLNDARVLGSAIDIHALHLKNTNGELTATGDLSITVKKELNNQGGKLTSGGDFRVTTPSALNNKGGTVSSGGALWLSAKQVESADGVIKGKTVDVAIEKTNFGGRYSYVSNARGLIQAAQTLTIHADRIENADTRSNKPSRPLGLVGQSIALYGSRSGSLLDNTLGSVVAGKRLTLQTEGLQNGTGVLSSLGQFDLELHTLNNNPGALDEYGRMRRGNAPGQVVAGDRLSIKTLQLFGGTLQSKGELQLTILNDPKRFVMQPAVRGKLINTSKILAGGDLTLNAVSLNNQHYAGELVAGGATTLNLEKALDNYGVIAGRGVRINASTINHSHSGQMSGGAGSIEVLTTDYAHFSGEVKADQDIHIHSGTEAFINGSVQAGNTLAVEAGTKMTYTGQLVASGDQGSIRVQAPVIKTSGFATAGKDVTLAADQLDLVGTTLSTPGTLMLHTAGDIHTRGATLQGKELDLRAKNLYHAGGHLAAKGNLTATLSGFLDNTSGTLSAGGDLTATVEDVLNNTNGTLSAGGTASLDAAALHNESGVITAQSVVAKASGPVLNTGGLIQATENLAFSADQIKNQDTRSEDPLRPLGLIGKTVALTSRAFDNTRGSVTAEERLTLDTQALDLTEGVLHSGGDLALTVKGDLDQAGALSSGRDMTVLVTGKLENAGPVSAGGDLTLNAAELTNTTSGELAARGAQRLKVGQVLTNRGVIDGGATHIEAAQVNNQGRLYGDRLAIRAGVLTNEEGPASTPILASHGDMDLGLGTLISRDHGLMYAGGNLRVGSDLDTNTRAFGQASSLLNRSATIEVGGDATIAAASIQNENADYASTVVLTSVTLKVYYRPEGTTDRYDGQTTWLCHLEDPGCSKDPGWLGGDLSRRMLLPSTSYPESRYGPTFNYTAPFITSGIGGATAPIKPLDIHPTKPFRNDFSGSISNDQFIEDPAAKWSKIYPADSKVGDVFGVKPPEPRIPEEHLEIVKNKEKALQAYNAYIAPVHELDRRIRSFNADFEHRMVTNFAIDRVDETVRESRTLSTDPALILVNDDARFNGSVVNDKSQIVTGGKLSVDGPEIRNVGATGERRIEHEGTSTRVWRHRKKGGILGGSKPVRLTDEPQSYRAVISVEPIELPVAVAMGSEAGQAEQKDFISTLHGKHQAFTVRPEADASYLVATDPRLVGQREVVSSDVLLDLLTSEGSKDKSVGKRAGDGFYEQKLVSDQIRLATGQRFLPSFHDNDAQYRALLSAGVQLAKAEGLKIGEPLTPSQIRQLTTDRTWLIKQSVTLPDGTTQQVLVPKVYLKAPLSKPTGSTLLAGHDINLSASKDLTNTDTIGARESSVLTAHTLVNEEGGRIQGNQIELTAKEDLVNRAATITGEAVALRAGRDVVLASTSEYDHQDDGQFSYWSRAISGVSRVQAGRLDIDAERDIALTAAHVTAHDDARLKAGRDIALDSLLEGQGRSAVYGAHNRMAVSTSSELGTTIATDHALALLAGQDVRTRASEVTVGGALTVDAGQDIQLSTGQTNSSAYDERTAKTSGLFSSKKTHSIHALDWSQAQGSTMTGDSVMLTAGRDVNVAGSTVGAQHDLTLKAKSDVAIVSATNTLEGLQYEQIKKSGFGTSGGVSYGRRDQLDSLESLRTEVVPSTLGSIEGSVKIRAGKTVAIEGSQVLAPEGNVTVSGQKITLDPAVETLREKEVHARSQSGLTVSGSTPLVSGFQVGQRMEHAVRQLGNPVDNPVMTALAGLTTGLAAKNTYDALMMDPQHLDGASVMASVGSSKHRTQTERESSKMHGSTLHAGQDLTLLAQGAGQDSDIVVTGSTLSAGQDVLLKADGDLLLQAAQNKAFQQTKSAGHSASLGVGLSLGAQKAGLTGELGASKTRGHADGQDISWTPSTVTANRLLTIESSGDTTFKGAQGQAKQIVADVGGDLLLESLQDTST
jgi:filamentous hemagglutinin